MSEWWAHVMLRPEDRRISVFKRGTPRGSKGTTPRGGQATPSSMHGAKLLWKKAQKNEEKNIISERIKRIIPDRRPFSTNFECSP
jgi:hypothetical protein